MSAVQTSTYIFMFRYMLNHFEFPAPPTSFYKLETREMLNLLAYAKDR